MTKHIGFVSSVAFEKDDILASGSSDKTIKLWNIMNGLLIRILTGHTGSVRRIAFGKDVLASGSSDCTIKLRKFY